MISAITTTSGFVFNDENMSVAAGDYFSAEALANTSADVNTISELVPEHSSRCQLLIVGCV